MKRTVQMPILDGHKKQFLGIEGWKWRQGCRTEFTIRHAKEQNPSTSFQQLLSHLNENDLFK